MEKILAEVKAWEGSHTEDLKRLSFLFRKMIYIIKENGGEAVLRYNIRADRLKIWIATRRRILPNNLYSKLDHVDTEAVLNKKALVRSNISKTELKIGNSLYYIDLSMILYLELFIRFNRTCRPQGSEYTHGDIPLFNTILQGLESGYRFCFRSLLINLAQYHTLYDTYDFLRVDMLGG